MTVNRSNNRFSFRLLHGLLFFSLLFFFACSPTKYLKENEYLLVKSEIKIVDDKKVADYYPEDYIRQKPNKKLLGVPMYVRIYNLVDPAEEAKREAKRKLKEDKINRKRLEKGKETRELNGFGKWLRKIGEEPIVFNKVQMRKSSQQITTLLKNKGYFNAKTIDSVKYKGKTASVKYVIKAGKPYKIRNYKDSIEDPEVPKLLDSHFANKSKIKKGELVDVSYFDEERTKINEIMLENGYYRFAKEYIFFQVDTFVGNNQADVKILIKSPVETDDDGRKKITPHKKYYIRSLKIYPDHEPKAIIQKKKQETINYDTVPGEKGFTFLVAKKNKHTQAVLTRGVTIATDSIYRASKAKGSFTYYSSLSNFRLINFDFREPENIIGDTGRNFLDTHIKLTPSTPQSFTIELEGNTTSGRFGTAANLLYRHSNVFRGAEILDVKFSGELNNQEEGFDDNSNFSDKELGVSASIRFPNLLMPFSSRSFYLKYFPKTALSVGYSFRFNSNYRRSIFSSSFGYDWRSGDRYTHSLNVLEFSSVKLTEINPTYLDQLQDNGQFDEKYDHLILGSSYTMTFNSQKVTKSKDFHYIMIRLEPAGNILNLIQGASNAPKLSYGKYMREVEKAKLAKGTSDAIIDLKVDSLNLINSSSFYTLFNLPYAQYFKTEIDFRYYQILNSKNELVYRINPGIIIPYRNSYYSPQEKRFFLGGASSMRAWPARQIGPGSFKDTVDLGVIYQYGDIKLEMNLEYRFKLFWMIEGALFADAGNIWSLAENDAEEKKFDFSRFYKEIALGTGVGLRMDFSFFVFRFDFGVKLYDPSIKDKSKWLGMDTFSKDKGGGITVNFGIGYPF